MILIQVTCTIQLQSKAKCFSQINMLFKPCICSALIYCDNIIVMFKASQDDPLQIIKLW